MIRKWRFLVLLSALFVSAGVDAAWAAGCREQETAVPPPTLREKKELVAFLNRNGLSADDSRKGHYRISANVSDPDDAAGAYFQPWDIEDGGDSVYRLFKGDVDNDGIEDYLLVAEGGTGHYDRLVSLFHGVDGRFVLVNHQAEQPIIPGFVDGSEASDLPGHFADPFLTTRCGVVYLNFVDSAAWTVGNLKKLQRRRFLWKDGRFNAAP